MKIDAIGLTPPPTVENSPSKVEDPSFAKTLANAQKNKDDAKLWDACQQFESVFINMMLKQMRATVPKDDFFGDSMGEEVFQGMLDEQTSDNVAKSGSMGLAQMIYQQMTQSNLVSPPVKKEE